MKETSTATVEELQERIAKALGLAEAGVCDGGHHKMWVIDQMVRALCGVPMEGRSATDSNGKPYTYEAQGENDAYAKFVGQFDGWWDEGSPP
ncbi:MAG: hypothetical protein JSS66_06285 [Armatimonadetes bacterium]|nr:hypothetical protein [Armatimonadota bacterium]